jgi:sugar phosphate isomerase/epimerase
MSSLHAARLLISEGFDAIELSGGIYEAGIYEELLSLSRKTAFQIHNYFPPVQIPYVLNLASLDSEIADRSLSHATTAMRWAADFGATAYSVHAGFLIDPRIDELGVRIKRRTLYNRVESVNRFMERVNNLAEFGQTLGLRLLIENNVLIQDTFDEFGENPLLVCNPDEAFAVMQSAPKNVGMLLDVAHLKVSANTLGFNPSEMFSKCRQWIEAYHLSENDGSIDTHHPFRNDSWFWPYLNKTCNYYSIEVYCTSMLTLHQQVHLVREKLNGG